MRNLSHKIINGLAGFEIAAGAAVYNAFSGSAFTHFTFRAMTNLYTGSFARSTINHVRRKIKIMRLFPFSGCLFPQRLIVVFHCQIRIAPRAVQTAISNHLFHKIPLYFAGFFNGFIVFKPQS